VTAPFQTAGYCHCEHCQHRSGTTSTLGVRVGALEGDPGIRPEWHQFVASMPAWEGLPDDGLPRYPRARPAE
jgi:hypothetical protein